MKSSGFDIEATHLTDRGSRTRAPDNGGLHMALQSEHIPAHDQADKGQEAQKEDQIHIQGRIGLYIELPVERHEANGNRYCQIFVMYLVVLYKIVSYSKSLNSPIKGK